MIKIKTAGFSSILLIAGALYFPFVNKPVSMDSDMMIHVSKMMMINPIDPPLGDYGNHMACYNIHTGMPQRSVFYRCPHPPLIPIILAPVIYLSNGAEWPMHCFMFLFYLLGIAGFYLLLTYIAPDLRWKATVLFAISPALVINGLNIMWDIPNTAFILWAIALIVGGVQKNSKRFLLCAGIFTGLAALTKISCFPLYIAVPLYLILLKKYRFLLLWAIPAFILPLIWVTHNFVVYGQIQYLTTCHSNIRLPDIRYHLERYVTMLGGCMVFPLWLFWIYIRNWNRSKILILSAIPALIWSTILFFAHKLTLLQSLAYFLFAAPGIAIFISTCMMFLKDRTLSLTFPLRIFFILFIIVYLAIILIHPAAETRFLLPIMTLCIVWLCAKSQLFNRLESGIFWISLITLQIAFTYALSFADYSFSDCDRKVPEWLKSHSLEPGHTWYYGRLSYDYYLNKNGYKNILLDGKIRTGDYLVHEAFPGDYPVLGMIGKGYKAVPIDSVEFYHFPLRTMPPGGGFHGTSRLPYFLMFNVPQKKFILYHLSKG